MPSAVPAAMPRPPTNLRVSDVTSESVRLTWSYDLDQETIQYYVIEFKQKHRVQQVRIAPAAKTLRNSIVIH